jgi:FkbM family methyltransferase
MTNMIHLLKNIVKRTPAYTVYRLLVKHRRKGELIRVLQSWSQDDQRRLEFYSQFIQPGDLVFDVGANVGNRTKVFLKLGARVIAVEPQRQCAVLLESAFRGSRSLTVVRKALGATPVEAEMLMADVDTISSLSPEWVRSVRESGRFRGHEWTRTERVEVDTLDNLIKHYGRPAFVKIDVEGYELEVLSGLSTPVRALSFEFTPEYLANTVKCIDRICGIAGARFQISLEETMRFAFPTWMSAAEAKAALAGIDAKTFGDLYVRLRMSDHPL